MACGVHLRLGSSRPDCLTGQAEVRRTRFEAPWGLAELDPSAGHRYIAPHHRRWFGVIVEFAGCSGAGKTTLLRYVRGALESAGESCVEPYEHFVRHAPCRWTSALRSRCAVSTSWANLAVELFSWPSVLMGRRRFAECDRWVRHRIREAAFNWREQVRLTRSWNRKLAVMAGCREKYRESHGTADVSRNLLQDEGTVHFATTLLARMPDAWDARLDEYLSLIPLPDRIVMVTTASDRAAHRLSRRSYIPAPDRRGVDRERTLQRAREIMCALAEHPRVASRLVSAANDTDNVGDLQVVAGNVVSELQGKVCARSTVAGVCHSKLTYTVATGGQVS